MATAIYPVASINGAQFVPVPTGIGGSHALALLFSVAPSAGTVSVDYRLVGGSVFIPLTRAQSMSVTSGHADCRADGPVAEYRLTFAGLVGGSGARLWVNSQEFPPGVFGGLSALTVQSYIEANVKNGVQFESSSLVTALGAGANFDTIFTTGAKPVAVKARQIVFNGAHLEARVFRGPTFTGGTLAAPFNLSDINPVATTVTIRGGVTTTATGTEIGAPSFMIGSDIPGSSSAGTYAVIGSERNLRPNTAYLLRVTNTDVVAQRVSGYATWYEGGLDLPL